MVETTRDQATPERLRDAPGYVVRRLYQAYTAAWGHHVDSTLTGPQFAVLTAVCTYPGVDQGSLAASVALDRSTMADVCRRLEDRGLIRRETAPGDGRRKLLHLTEVGASLQQSVAERVDRLNLYLMSDDAEPPALIDRLDKLSHRWESISHDERL